MMIRVWFVAALCAGILGCRRDPVRSDAVRVVSLAPNLTETVCAIGAADCLVGRTTACTYPPEIVTHVPAIGAFGRPALELLVAASPSLILDVDLADETIGQKIDRLGLRRERIACRTLDDIPNAVDRIGALLDRQRQAALLSAELRNGLAAYRSATAAVSNRPTVYVEVWHDPMMTVGGGTFLSDLIELAGGENIAHETDRDYFQVSPEWVMACDPDVILCLFESGSTRARDLITRRLGWDAITAVRTGRVYDGFDQDLILRPGPRVLDSVAQLRQCIQDVPK